MHPSQLAETPKGQRSWTEVTFDDLKYKLEEWRKKTEGWKNKYDEWRNDFGTFMKCPVRVRLEPTVCWSIMFDFPPFVKILDEQRTVMVEKPVSIWRASQSLTVLSAEAERIQLWFWKISKDFCWSWNLGSESRDRTALVCPRSLATMQGGESPCVLILMTPLLYIVYITITNIEFTR